MFANFTKKHKKLFIFAPKQLFPLHSPLFSQRAYRKVINATTGGEASPQDCLPRRGNGYAIQTAARRHRHRKHKNTTTKHCNCAKTANNATKRKAASRLVGGRGGI